MITQREDPVRTFLDSVRTAQIEYAHAMRKLQQLTSQCESITPALTGMPRSGGGEGGGLAQLWASLADERSAAEGQILSAQRQKIAVEEFIAQLPSAEHRLLLNLRYLDLLDWPEVAKQAQQCGVYSSMRSLFRLHGAALKEARVLWAELHPGEEVESE